MQRLLITIGICIVAGLIIFMIGFLLGYFLRDVKTKIQNLFFKLEEQPKIEVGATPGSYHVVNENRILNDMGKRTGAVLPKTPQLLEYEEQQRIIEMQNQRTA